jgi:hypothetical protein
MRASTSRASQACLTFLTMAACRAVGVAGACDARMRRRAEEASWRHSAAEEGAHACVLRYICTPAGCGGASSGRLAGEGRGRGNSDLLVFPREYGHQLARKLLVMAGGLAQRRMGDVCRRAFGGPGSRDEPDAAAAAGRLPQAPGRTGRGCPRRGGGLVRGAGTALRPAGRVAQADYEGIAQGAVRSPGTRAGSVTVFAARRGACAGL